MTSCWVSVLVPRTDRRFTTLWRTAPTSRFGASPAWEKKSRSSVVRIASMTTFGTLSSRTSVRSSIFRSKTEPTISGSNTRYGSGAPSDSRFRLAIRRPEKSILATVPGKRP